LKAELKFMKLKDIYKTILLLLCLFTAFACGDKEKDDPTPVVDLRLEESSVNLELLSEIKKRTTVKILAGNGGYQATTDPVGIVMVKVQGNEIAITGMKQGSTTITVTDGKGKSATIEVNVTLVAPGVPTFREDFNTDIDEDIWIRTTHFEHHGQTGKERCFTKDGYLNLLWENKTGPEPPWLGSAIQSHQKFLYGKWEVRLKASSTPNVLNSFYTIDWRDGNGTRQEIDIEFLTRTFGENSGKIHLALHDYHEGEKRSYGVNIDLDFNPSDDFHEYGFSVYRDKIEWFVDGNIIHTHVYDIIKVDYPYNLKLNHWTDPKGEWVSGSEGPPPAGTTSTYLVDWIQFTPFD